MYKQHQNDLTKIFNERIRQCKKYPNHLTKDKSVKIETHLLRFESKCNKIKEFRLGFIRDPQRYGVEIEKRLMDLEGINKKLNDILDSILKRRRDVSHINFMFIFCLCDAQGGPNLNGNTLWWNL